MPRIEIWTRRQVFAKRPRVKQASDFLLDRQLPPGVLACHRLEIWACADLVQMPEAMYQVIACGDESYAVLYRHAMPLRLCSPVAGRILPSGQESRDMQCLAIRGLIVAEFP